MKKLLVASVAAAATLSIAHAADSRKPVYKAPPPAASPIAQPLPFSWTGFYLGGHIGRAWSHDWTSTFNPLPSPEAFGALPNSFTQKGSGTIAGGQVGFNWQFAPFFVVGAEADLSHLHIHTSSVELARRLSGEPFPNETDCPGLGNFCITFMTRDVDSLATVRGRIGVAWDHLFAYFTGGAAFSRLSYTANFLVCCQHPAAFSEHKTGSVIGGGLEYALPGPLANWTIRGEYLWVHFGGAAALVPEQSPPSSFFVARYDWSDSNFHTARFGLNYKFDFGKGKGPAPLVARY